MGTSMERQIHPNPWIIDALSSESEHATPFSCIPGFIKKYAIRKEQEMGLVSILSSVWEKELSYLGTRVEKIQNIDCAETPDVYQQIIEIESWVDGNNKKNYPKLLWLAKQIIASEMWAPVYQILKEMNIEMNGWAIDPSVFDNHNIDSSEQFSESDKNLVRQEQQVRVIMNALIMWAGHRIFDKVESDPKYPKTINKISPDLYQSYYDMVYTNLKQMWEHTPNWAWINTGSMELSPADDGTKINIKADIFPVLLHEMAKWVIEYMAYARYNALSPELTQSILSVDSRESEHRMMLVWPQIYKQLFFLIKESIAQYNETKWVLVQKEESDYIMPVFSRLVQLPATDFLAFMEMILRQDQSGAKPIAFIKNIIQDIDAQYVLYLQSSSAPQTELTIDQIVKQLVRELEIGEDCQNFVVSALPKTKAILESAGYGMSDKKLAKKLSEYFSEYAQKYWVSESLNDWFLVEFQDALEWLKKSRIEQLAFSNIHEQQKKFPKRTKNHEKQSINIHPRFPLSALEEAKQNISPELLQDIDNKIADFIQKWSIRDWIQDHDTMSTTLAKLTDRFITLDSTVPECLMEWENNRWLYELTTLEQLKRESGSMWWHCVADFIDSIRNGRLKVFSLRFWTQSRWTIGYETNDKTINQVKWYTNQRKNAILSTDDPDYDQVLRALQYITKIEIVEKINDVHVLYQNGMVLTTEGLLFSHEFEKLLSTSDPYEIMPLQENVDLFLSTPKMLNNLNLRNVKKLHFMTWWVEIVYDVKSKKIEVVDTMPWAAFDPTELANIMQSLLSITIQPFFAEYDEYPLFGRQWLPKHRAIVKKHHNYWMVKKDEHWYREILPCEYSSFPNLNISRIGKKSDKVNNWVVYQSMLSWIITETPDGNWIETLPCEFQDMKFFLNEQSWRITVDLRKWGKIWRYEQQSDYTWKELIPCKYDELPSKYDDLPWGFGWLRGLKKDELCSENDGKYGIVRQNSDGTITELLACQYQDSSGFWYEWLPANQSIAKKNGKFGILQRNNDTFEDILSYEYDSISALWKNGLSSKEALVQKDKKYWVVSRNMDGAWQEILPCLYDEAPKFWLQWLSLNQAILKEKGKYGMIKRNINWSREFVLPCQYDQIPQFLTELLPAHELILTLPSQVYITQALPVFESREKHWIVYTKARTSINGQYCLRERNTDNTWIQKSIESYSKFEKIPWLAPNEVVAFNNSVYTILRKNEDGTFTHTSSFEFSELPKFWVAWLSPNEAWVRNNWRYWVIARNADGEYFQTLSMNYIYIINPTWKWNIAQVDYGNYYSIVQRTPEGKWIESNLSYPNITKLSEHFPDNQFIVKTETIENNYWIISVQDDGTWDQVIEFVYDELRQHWANALIAKRNGKTTILEMNEAGFLCKHFAKDYDEILQCWTWGLLKNEAIVRDNWELKFIKNRSDIDEILFPDYLIKGFGESGLLDGQARAKKKWAWMWIVRKNSDDTLTELLPCKYNAIGVFGQNWLPEDEAIISLEGEFETKQGLVKKIWDSFIELLPCDYYVIHSSDETGVWVQEERDGKYTFFQKTSEWVQEAFPSRDPSDINLKFWEGEWLLSNEAYLFSKNWDWWIWLIRKLPDWRLDLIFDDSYSFESPIKINGLLKNEYKILNDGLQQIVRRNVDGSREEVSPCYESIARFGSADKLLTENIQNSDLKVELNMSENEVFVLNDDYYGVMKRMEDWSFKEIVPCKYILNWVLENRYAFPVSFYPELVDGLRVAIAAKDFKNCILVEDKDTGILNEIENPEIYLTQEGHEELAKFCKNALVYDMDYPQEFEDEKEEVYNEVEKTIETITIPMQHVKKWGEEDDLPF